MTNHKQRIWKRIMRVISSLVEGIIVGFFRAKTEKLKDERVATKIPSHTAIVNRVRDKLHSRLQKPKQTSSDE